jgi:uncharacterized membrane protein YphA (DoxX/SURF4 family)
MIKTSNAVSSGQTDAPHPKVPGARKMESSAVSAANKPLPNNKLNIVLWIVQALLALVFLFAGAVKLIIPIAAMARQIGLPVWFLHFVAVCEVLGGLGLILPGITRIRPALTPLAASGLVIIMIGATWVSVAVMGPKSGLTPAIVGLLSAFVAYARWRLAPHRNRT